MPARTLKNIQDKILSQQYVMTLHAVEEMEDDGFTVDDVEECILTGQIIEEQEDRTTGETKFCIEGKSVGGNRLEVVVKFGPTMLVIITVYAL